LSRCARVCAAWPANRGCAANGQRHLKRRELGRALLPRHAHFAPEPPFLNFQQLRSVRDTVRQGFNLTFMAEALADCACPAASLQ
jgi:hypothetical protein